MLIGLLAHWWFGYVKLDDSATWLALTGNFARPGCTNLHTQFSPGGLVGRSRESRRRTPVTGERVIAGMFPAAAIPDAVLTDAPDRFRAAIIESSNPVHSLPDSPRMREAMAALEFSVVIDITMTETARCADYVLPARRLKVLEAGVFWPTPDDPLHRYDGLRLLTLRGGRYFLLPEQWTVAGSTVHSSDADTCAASHLYTPRSESTAPGTRHG